MLLEYCIFGVITFLMKGAQCEATEVFAELGSQAVLPCRSSSSSPIPPAIIWSKANKGTVWRKQKSGLQYWGASWLHKGIQRVRCPHSQFERDDYSLHILNVREDDGGIYSCWVDLSGKVFETKVTLRIIKVSVSPSVAMWGGDVSIGCSVTPWPEDATVQWTLNNSPFVPRTEIPSSRDAASSVVREKATARLNGNWTCVVGYKGKEVRASGTLAVKGIIQPSTDDMNVYAAVGSAVTLPCVFSPDLIPSNSVWEKLKPGYLLKPSLDRLPASFSPSSPSSQSWDKSASLTEVGFEDQGRYRCSGTVDGQRLTRNMQLVVAKIVSSIPSKKKDSVTLTCQLSDARKITEYEWVRVVYDLKGTQSAGSVHRGKTLSISKVSEENWGEWACRFYGKEGILGNVTHHIQLMSGLSGQKLVSGFSNHTVAMLCLSVLLLVLLLILAQMYKNHQRRKRIFQYPALETIVHTASNEREERERSREKE